MVLLSGKVHLGGHHVEEPAIGLEMEVGWPNPPSRNWVRPGLNRLERVHAVFVCAGFAKAEKVRVLRCRVWIGDMDIPPFQIGRAAWSGECVGSAYVACKI